MHLSIWCHHYPNVNALFRSRNSRCCCEFARYVVLLLREVKRYEFRCKGAGQG